jgi:hypothetical protein
MQVTQIVYRLNRYIFVEAFGMSINTRMIKFILSLLVFGSLAQCGRSANDEDLALVEITPDEPIVFTADKEDLLGNEIKAPWFDFRLRMDNQTKDVITVIALKANITGIDKSGLPTTTKWEITASHFNFSTETQDCVFSHFGEWQQGEDKVFELFGSCNYTPLFTVASLPEGNGVTFRYRIDLTILGWFGTYEAPSDRFEKKLIFYSR